MRKAVPAPSYSAERQLRRRRKRARRRLVFGALALVMLGVLFSIVHPVRRAPHRDSPPPLAVLAPAAQPDFLRSGVAWSDEETQRLRSDVAPIVNAAAFPPTSSAIVVDARDGRVLYEHNANMPLIPGSTVKLITASAALETLGPSYRFVTSIVSDGTLAGGQLNGDVWLLGGGDPELTSDDLRRGTHAIARRGVAQISGNVYADGSRYGDDAVNASWLPEDLQYGWAAPASAISIDGGSVQFTITPRLGAEATVMVDPPGEAEHVIASVRTVAADAANTLRIDVLPNGAGYEVSGEIPYGAPQKYWRSVPHPTKAAAASLLQMLRMNGITVAGYAAERTAPPGAAALWRHESRPLAQILQRMFFLSDNHVAEELLRAVGWKATGLGTLPNALRAEREFLARHQIRQAHSVLADGSGLSASNKISARMLAGVLGIMARQRLEAPYRLLPRAGMEGTVGVRDLSAQAKGRIYAKDGYISGASSIAGFALTAHHGPVIFAFLANDWQHGLDAVWDGQDQALDRLVRY